MYAVVFVTQKSPDPEGYAGMLEKMLELARQQPGFVRVDTIGDGSHGITISWWETLKDIDNWRRHPRHVEAKKRGRERWYQSYSVAICKVERQWQFQADEALKAPPL